MSRTIEQILRDQLGTLLVQQAMMQSQIEALNEEIAKLKLEKDVPEKEN